MRKTLGLLVTACLLASVAPSGVAAADPTAPPPIADQLVVRYRTGTTAAERRAITRDLGLTQVHASVDGRTQVVLAAGQSPATIRRQLGADPRVLAVAPNFRRELADEITDEDGFAFEWGLHNTGQLLDGERRQTGIADIDIDGLEALRITHGSADVIVAVIDDGVDLSHPDLDDRIWTNPGEAGALATNGVDDDGNGFIDDVHGWDFCNNDNTVHDAGEDFHGTHVAGTIAASLNGTGVVGVAPGVTILPVKFIDNSVACGTDQMAMDAIDYAASFGVPIINASWGGPDRSIPLELAIGDSGALFVAAAGNAGWNLEAAPTSTKKNRFYPAGATLANILSVAAVDQRGALASFSNYGSVSVDIGAPGTNILSSYPGGYAWIAGTSMAAPHVAGCRGPRRERRGDPVERHRPQGPGPRPRHRPRRGLRQDDDRSPRQCVAGGGCPRAHGTPRGPARDQCRVDRRLDRQHDPAVAGRDRCDVERGELRRQAAGRERRLDHGHELDDRPLDQADPQLRNGVPLRDLRPRCARQRRHAGRGCAGDAGPAPGRDEPRPLQRDVDDRQFRVGE